MFFIFYVVDCLIMLGFCCFCFYFAAVFISCLIFLTWVTFIEILFLLQVELQSWLYFCLPPHLTCVYFDEFKLLYCYKIVLNWVLLVTLKFISHTFVIIVFIGFIFLVVFTIEKYGS